MSHPDIQKAKEWAESRANGNYLLSERTKEAVKVIQSLPDTVADGDKLREVIADWGDREVTPDAYTLYRQVLALLPTPSLPTLADMTPEERKACQWMQADLNVLGDTYRVVILNFANERAYCLRADGACAWQRLEDITPLPGEPRLKWPGSVEDAPAVGDEPIMMPRPEDVPAGKVWIVQYDGEEWVGCRNDPGTRLPWLVIRRDEPKFDYCYDTDITLISCLVPEVSRG